MHTTLRICKLGFEIGWFKGSDFSLFELQLLSNWSSMAFCIFSLKIAKFTVSLFIDQV